MTRRVIGWFAGIVRPTDTGPEVHFHRGPGSTPAVCFDAHCRSPRLDA